MISVLVPSGQPPPQVNGTTPTSVSLIWEEPEDPNGIISSYSVIRRVPALFPSPLRRDVGTAFDGNVIKRFPSTAITLGGISNTITFSFRTFSPQGVLLYYINSAGTDYIGIELRRGVPWFFFDAGSGPAIVQPDLAGADVTFNDGEWHSVTATQTSRVGRITVDGTYSGMGESSGSDQVISSQQELHIGGIPSGVPRSSALGLQAELSTLRGRNYAGCLFGLTLNGQSVDFDESVDVGDSVITDIPGCSIELEPGLSFLGGGFLSYPPNTLSSNSFSWRFDVRTTHSQGLVFFAHAANQSSIAVEVSDSLVHLVVSSGGSTQRVSVGDNSTCDGEWHGLLLDQSLDEIFISVDGIGRSLFLQATDIVFSSDIYFGGIPTGTLAYNIARDVGVNVYAPLSGCVRPLTSQLVVGGVTSLVEIEPSSQYLVRFDGCPTGSTGNPSCSEPWMSLSAGASTEFDDSSLQPWTGKSMELAVDC